MTEHSVMEYVYRDAGNFKSYGKILLEGRGNRDDIARIEAFFDSGEFFVAEQLNIPVLYQSLWSYSNGITNADHAFHEFLRLRLATEAEVLSMEIWGNVDDLFNKLNHINNNWDCSLSVHCGV